MRNKYTKHRFKILLYIPLFLSTELLSVTPQMTVISIFSVVRHSDRILIFSVLNAPDYESYSDWMND
jgi:hypothetical protein